MIIFFTEFDLIVPPWPMCLIQTNRYDRQTVRNSENNEQIEKQKVGFVPLGMRSTQFELAPFQCFISNVIRVGPFLTIFCVTRTPPLIKLHENTQQLLSSRGHAENQSQCQHFSHLSLDDAVVHLQAIGCGPCQCAPPCLVLQYVLNRYHVDAFMKINSENFCS